MPKDLLKHIAKTFDAPLVEFNNITKTLRIEGKSYPEDSFHFYKVIQEWVVAHFKNEDTLIISLELIYINSASDRAIFELFETLVELKNKKHDIQLTWNYDTENESMEEAGEDYQEDFPSLEIKLRSFTA